MRGNVSKVTFYHYYRCQETPLPMYVSMKIHAVTRSRGLVDMLFNLGLCVSYDKLLQLTSNLVNGICQRVRMEDVVCPPKLRQGLFTTAAAVVNKPQPKLWNIQGFVPRHRYLASATSDADASWN